MTGDNRNDGSSQPGGVARFPYSRVRPAQLSGSDINVSYGALAKVLGIPHEQTTGHWCSRCSRCSRIWYGYLLEVTCPMCGNRHG